MRIRITGNVPAGKDSCGHLGVGDVGNIVLRDRKHLSEDCIIVVNVTIQRKWVILLQARCYLKRFCLCSRIRRVLAGSESKG